MWNLVRRSNWAHFCEDITGGAVAIFTVINNFFLHQMKQLSLQNIWFQQNAATCHTARETIERLT